MVAGLLLAFVAALPARAETRALFISVSRYESAAIPDLAGPANDMAALLALSSRMGLSDVVTLSDRKVSRSSVEQALHDLGRRSQPGDWIVLTYSGHGAQAAARTASASDGAYDQFLPLPGFDPARQDPETFIVDKDIYAWIKRYVPDEVRMLLLVDSCHSGTMHRAVDPRRFGFTSRLAFRAGGENQLRLSTRPAPRLPALRGAAIGAEPVEGRKDLPNLVYLGASQDDQLALEAPLPREGSPQRGLLTFAFEQGLTAPGLKTTVLAADIDGDGAVTVLELSTYLNSHVRMLSAQRQESSAFFPSNWADMPILGSLPRPGTSQEAPPPSVRIAATGAPTIPPDMNWRLTDSNGSAEFVWQVDRGEVVRSSGDIVATGVHSVDAFTGVIDKWRTVMALRPLVAELTLRTEIMPAGADYVYAPGERIKVSLLPVGRRVPKTGLTYATVFNLASDGTVQLLFPLGPDGDGAIPDEGVKPVLDTEAVTPLGADHLISITTPRPPQELRATLRALDGKMSGPSLAATVRRALTQAGGRGALSMAELYTGD